MGLWRKASGALKDKNSILISSLAKRTAYRNPDLESAIIKTTSHDDTRVDYKNAQRVFSWMRTSPTYLKPILNALTLRLEKTHSWVVALKGLMLMHGIFYLKIPSVRKIGRLPFDLSSFRDLSYSSSSHAWSYNPFIRAYFKFLDQKSAFLTMESKEEMMKTNKNKPTDETIVQQLIKLQRCQTLLDMLLKIKPEPNGLRGILILEAMDCIIVEVFDVYSRICNGIARTLIRIYGAGKMEATLALGVLQKAARQSDQLSKYFEFCRGIGVLKASEFPKVERIPEEDIRGVEKIINGDLSDESISDDKKSDNVEHKSIVATERRDGDDQNKSGMMKTIVTEKWEVFDEDFKEINSGFLLLTQDEHNDECMVAQPYEKKFKQEIPDLISF